MPSVELLAMVISNLSSWTDARGSGRRRAIRNRAFISFCRAGILLGGLLFASAPLQGQPYPQPDETLPGFKSNDILFSGTFDNISAFSGDTGGMVPLGPTYPLSPNVTFALKAYNTLKFWHVMDSDCTTSNGPGQPVTKAFVTGYPTLGAGWTMTPGYVMPAEAVSGWTYVYVSPDGSHHFAGSDGNMVDNSRLRITCNTTNPPWSSCKVWFPDGTQQIFANSMPEATPTFPGDFDLDADGSALGLTSIVDSFGNQVLSVQYATLPTPVWEVTSITVGGGQSIVYTWGSESVNGQSWPVVTKLTFPPIGSALTGETISFAYNQTTILRSPSDTTVEIGCMPSDSNTANAPTLNAISFYDGSGNLVGSYAFGYESINSSPTGYLNAITLPTGGSISYTLASARSPRYPSTYPPLNLETTDPAGAPGPPPAGGGTHCFICDALSNSTAVASRTITDNARGVSGTTTYSRLTYEPGMYPLQTGSKLTRVVEVVEPKDGLNGSATQKLTRYLFHVEDQGISDPTVGGAEIEHSVYDGGSLTGTNNARTTIRCHDWVSGTSFCGYLNAAGTDANPFSGTGERPAGQVVWYGPKPSTGSDSTGGNCPLSGNTTKCVSTKSSTFDSTALEYQYSTTVSGNITDASGAASDVNRSRYTHWTAQVSPTEYLLDVFDKKSTWDGGAQPPPEQSDGVTVVSKWFETNLTTGFINGVTGWYSSTPTTQFGNCRYPDTTTGAVLEEVQFTAAESSRINAPCQNYFPSWSQLTNETVLGMNSDFFGHQYLNASPSGLLNTAQWVVGTTGGTPQPLVWNAFDATRDIATGLITSSRDPSGHTTTYTYDALGRLTQIAPPNEAATNISYDSTTQTTVQRQESAGNVTLDVYRYDNLGRLARETRQLPSSLGYATKPYYYDSAGNQYLTGEWIDCATSPANCSATIGVSAVDCSAGGANANATTQCTYDPFGRPTRTWRPDGSRTDTNRTDGSALYSDTSETVNIYDTSGTLAVGAYTTSKDALGRVNGVTEPTGANTRYGYNILDKITCVIQGTGTLSPCSASSGQKRTFGYNSFGFMISELAPEVSTATPITYTYGSLGNVLTKSAPGSNNFTFANLEPAGRPTLAAITGGSTYHTFSYDSGCVSTNKTNCGKLTSQVGSNPLVSTAPVVTQNYTYSSVDGKLTSRSTVVNPTIAGQETFTDSWSYTPLGLIAVYTHPKPSTASTVDSTYTYQYGFPVTLTSQGTTLVSQTIYAASGSLKSWFVPGGGGSTITITPDPSGMPRPLTIGIAGPSLTYSTGNYMYDGAGDVTAMGSNTYAYNKRAMLNSTNVNGGATYTFDNFGNLTSAGAVNASTNRLSTGAAYDSLGNLTSFNSQSYAYDPFSRQKSATVGSVTENYIYDATDERMARIQPNNTPWYVTLRDHRHELATEVTLTSGGYTRTKEYFHFADRLAATEDMTTATFRSWLVDHLGTPRRGVTIAGAVEPHDYEPWGKEIGGSFGSDAIKFAQMERDSLTSNDNDHARFHLTGMGRFLSVDKHKGMAADPATWNRYTYSRDNPMKFVDWNGLEFGYPNQQRELDQVLLNNKLREAALANEGISDASPGIVMTVLAATGAGDLIAVVNAAAQIADAVSSSDAVSTGEQFGPQQQFSPNFVVTPEGDAIPIPDGSYGPTSPRTGEGMVYRGGSGGQDMSPDTTGVRVMDESANQGPHVNYMNKTDQTINPETGRTISNDDPAGHLPLKTSEPDVDSEGCEEFGTCEPPPDL